MLFVVAGWLSLAAQVAVPTSPPVVVRGRVVADSGVPLRNARIAIAGPSQQEQTTTDADGRFAISANTSSRISVAKAGYIATTLALPRPGTDVEIRLATSGAISGRITDTLGDPVIGMSVTAEAAGAPGSSPRIVATTETDDLGDYRLAGLPAGNFLVSVNAVATVLAADGGVMTAAGKVAATRNIPRANSDAVRRQMEARVYYPGVQTIDNATSVALAAGEDRPAIDFSAPALKPVDLFGGAAALVVPLGTTRVAGRVVPSSDSGTIRGRVLAADGRVLPRAIVNLYADPPHGRIPGAITDADGRFEFQQLPAIVYTVTATRAGFITASHGQRQPSAIAEQLDLKAAQRLDNIDIVLFPPRAIAGHVVDSGGEAVEGIDVRVLRIAYRNGRRRLVGAGGQSISRTDDRGAYRIYGLAPGQYIVKAGTPATYYPGTTSAQDALRIAVDSTQDVSRMDFALTPPPGVRVSGTVVDAAGRPLPDGLILTPSRRSGALAGDPLDAQIDPGGRFEFINVAPGEYVIQASKDGSNSNDEGESASQFLAVAANDVAGVTLRLSRGSTVKGRITFDGAASQESYFSLNLEAVAVDPDLTAQSIDIPTSARIRADGTFDLTGLNGPHVLRVPDTTDGWMLEAVLLNGRDVTDIPLFFGSAAQSIDGIEVVLTDRLSEVSGRALDARGSGMPGATVVLFPTDRTHWGETSRFVSAVTTGKDGAFTVRSLPPGDYYAAPVVNATRADLRDPELLDTLVDGATHVAISEGEKCRPRFARSGVSATSSRSACG